MKWSIHYFFLADLAPNTLYNYLPNERNIQEVPTAHSKNTEIISIFYYTEFKNNLQNNIILNIFLTYNLCYYLINFVQYEIVNVYHTWTNSQIKQISVTHGNFFTYVLGLPKLGCSSVSGSNIPTDYQIKSLQFRCFMDNQDLGTIKLRHMHQKGLLTKTKTLSINNM